MRQAVVTAVTASPNAVTVKIGASTNTVAGVRYFPPYSPVVNDVVFLLEQGRDLWVFGKLA
jgi:hypothetical protein